MTNKNKTTTQYIPDIPDIRRRIISLAVPSMGEFLLKMTIGIADTAMVGRLGAEALAVSGLSWSILFFLSMIVYGMNGGVSAVVARYVGAGDKKSASKAAGQAVILNFTGSVIITAIVFLFAEDLLTLLGAEKAIIADGARFLKILTSTYILSALMLSANAVIKASGDTKTPMKIFAVINIANIFLDYCLVFGKFGFPNHGVMGSAEATALVRFIGVFLSFGGMMMGWYKVKVKWKDIFDVDLNMLWTIIRIGGPSMFESFFFSTASMAFTKIITTLGTVPLAANNILFRAESFSYMPGIGFSIAASILVGQALGEDNVQKARVLAWEAAKIGMILMGSIGVIFLVWPEAVIRIFTDSPEVIPTARRTLRIVSAIQWVQGLMFCMLGTLKGAGDTRTTMKISLYGMWLVRVPFAWLLGIYLGAGTAGAWGGMCLDIAYRAIVYLRRYRGEEWTKIKV